MAAPNIDAVVALTTKAQDLEHKGHFARACEKWGAAIAAAQALQPLSPDPSCLIVASLQLKQASARNASVRLQPFATMCDAMAENVQQQAAAAATVLRRQAAHTLLEGACRPREVAWAAAYHRQLRLLEAPEELSGGLPHDANDDAQCVPCCATRHARALMPAR
jgi:hypothetical protein